MTAMSYHCWGCGQMAEMSTAGSCYLCGYVPAIMRDDVAKSDSWVVVGTTTIDGPFEQVREAFGGEWNDFDHMRYLLASGDVFNVGGRSLMIVDREMCGRDVIVKCDVVRRQSEVDAETLADATAKADAKVGEINARLSAAYPCPECGPHGNRGKVLGLEQTYDCTTCAGGRSGDVWGTEVQEIEVKPDDVWPKSTSGLSSYIEECRMRAAQSLMLDRKVLFGNVAEYARHDPEVTAAYPTLGDVPYASDINASTFGGLLVNGNVCLASGDIAEIRDGKVRSIIGRWA